jgi:hypothetical protein
MPSTVTLCVVHGPLRGAEFVFTERTTTIVGRAADCTPRLPGDAGHRTVSRHHCLIDINPPAVRIRDFGSLNGTYINGVPIGRWDRNRLPPDHGVAREHDLVDGDRVRLGNTVMLVRIRHTPTNRRRPPVTKALPRCAQCGAELPTEIGEFDGVQTCPNCRADIDTLTRRLLERGEAGDPTLASIAGHTLVRELGRGGMGRVHLARHTATGEHVALKLMLPAVAASRTATARFLREIEITKSLRHRHIAELRTAGSFRGIFYLTTQYCPGGNLSRYVERCGGRVPVGQAVALTLQALHALDYTHSRGIVHRDITPHNILLTADNPPQAKLTDFGIAKAFDLAGLSGLTRTGTAAGKPHFIPYQQVVNFRAAGPPVDVWALGACLYYMLTGTYPRDFPDGTDPWQIVLQTMPTPVSSRDASVPSGLARIVDEAVHDRPTFGFTSAAELHRALRHYAAAVGT